MFWLDWYGFGERFYGWFAPAPGAECPLPDASTPLTAPPSARSLHLYASALVARRSRAAAADVHAPADLVRGLRRVAAAVLRCGFPEAARWRSLPSPGEPPSLETFTAAGREWVERVDAALRAVAARDAGAAGEAAAGLSVLAERARMPLAAALLAEAASLCQLDDAERALRVATLARDRADHRAAEWWGKRAAMLAERRGQWETAVFAWARVADSWQRRGNYERALFSHRQELRAAERIPSDVLMAETLHTMAGVLWRAGRRDKAKDTARRASQMYGTMHPRLPALAHDVACMRMEEGDVRGAIPVFRCALSTALDARDSIAPAVRLACAGALCRDKVAYNDGVTAALRMLEATGYGDDAAWALAELARIAAEHVGDFTFARAWALWALTLAKDRGEAEPEKVARLVLAAVGV